MDITVPFMRGDVCVIDLVLTQGHEKYNRRPAVIVTNNNSNDDRFDPIVAVVPLTRLKPWKAVRDHQVLIEAEEGDLKFTSLADVRHVRSIDRGRVLRRVGRLRAGALARVDAALRVFLGMAEEEGGGCLAVAR